MEALLKNGIAGDRENRIGDAAWVAELYSRPGLDVGTRICDWRITWRMTNI